MTLIVACVWVRGNVRYPIDYVIRLRNMVARHLPPSIAWRFICLTDRPAECRAENIEAHEITPFPDLAGWWNKVQLFQPGTFPIGERVLYLDLDSIVIGDLEAVAFFPKPFALVPSGGTFRPKKFQTVDRFNSSVMAFTVGAGTECLATEFPALKDANLRLAGERRPLWGDQDWIGARLPHAATMPASWFPRFSECPRVRPPFLARVVLCKKPKNHIAAEQSSWVREAWR